MLTPQVFLAFPSQEILQTRLQNLTWSHYVELLRVDNEVARNWYLQEAAVVLSLSFDCLGYLSFNGKFLTGKKGDCISSNAWVKQF